MNNEKIFELAVILAAPSLAAMKEINATKTADIIKQCYQIVQMASKVVYALAASRLRRLVSTGWDAKRRLRAIMAQLGER